MEGPVYRHHHWQAADSDEAAERQTASLAGVAIILLLPRFTKRVPASIVALLVCTGASVLFHLPVETIGSKFGGIPRGLPPFAWPDFHFEHILPLIPSAFTVALLAALESMLSAVVADGMTGDRHNPNVELVAQGVAAAIVPRLAVQKGAYPTIKVVALTDPPVSRTLVLVSRKTSQLSPAARALYDMIEEHRA